MPSEEQDIEFGSAPQEEVQASDAQRFFETPASSFGRTPFTTTRRISDQFSVTPANLQTRQQQQRRRQQVQLPLSILQSSRPPTPYGGIAPPPGLNAASTSSRNATTTSGTGRDAVDTSIRVRAAVASLQQSKFVRSSDLDEYLMVNHLEVALRKEDYGVPGGPEYRKNMLSAVASLSDKFGVARHKVITSAEEGDQTKNKFVQQVLVGLNHRVKEGHERAKKFDFMDICTVADYSTSRSDFDPEDCSTWWGQEEINIWTDWELISETHVRAWQLSINRRFSDGDLIASLWLKEFIYNSSTDSLRTAIDKRYIKIPLEQRGGVTYLWYCLDEMFTMSREVRQAMLDFIDLFKRRGVSRYTGENILVVEEELMCVTKRLAADGSLTEDHVIDVLCGLSISSIMPSSRASSLIYNMLPNWTLYMSFCLLFLQILLHWNLLKLCWRKPL